MSSNKGAGNNPELFQEWPFSLVFNLFPTFSFLSKESLFHWHLLITETELIQAESPEVFYRMLVSRVRRSLGEQDEWELSALISPALG